MSAPNRPLAAVFGCAGLHLSESEAAFFRDTDPFGFVLFKRNVESPDQVSRLTEAMRTAVGREDVPVLVDQEGGRVQRLGPPHWRKASAAEKIGRIWETAPAAGCEAAYLNARLIGAELHACGISVDCAPVADLREAGAHDVIGNRSFGSSVDGVVALARETARGLLDSGLLPVVKHVPGHGRVAVDSHLDLPVVDASRADLEARDFEVFRQLSRMPLMMTAHMLFRAIDVDAPATQSARVIGEIIRGEIGFDGLLFSDDLSMNALSGSLGERAARSLAAGVDVALHCNGAMQEMQDIAARVSPITDEGWARWQRAEALRTAPVPLDEKAALDRLNVLLGNGEEN